MGGGGMKGHLNPCRALGRVAKNSADVYVVSTVSSTSNPLRSVTHMLPKP